MSTQKPLETIVNWCPMPVTRSEVAAVGKALRKDYPKDKGYKIYFERTPKEHGSLVGYARVVHPAK